ncbi:DASH complex subunit Dad3-domain-containing protein [Lipomyces arxii]|uniref:DASH complex subunit Dad3-domain-containing protein n=1 Tax=Lipomyces arxii TaxID=56418 RepID=UPI0034CD0915
MAPEPASAAISADLALHLLSPTEQELLKEYTTLSQNLNKLSSELARLATVPTPEILDNLRVLERKTAIVFTLLKASVYSIFLQQQLHEEESGMISNPSVDL